MGDRKSPSAMDLESDESPAKSASKTLVSPRRRRSSSSTPTIPEEGDRSRPDSRSHRRRRRSSSSSEEEYQRQRERIQLKAKDRSYKDRLYYWEKRERRMDRLRRSEEAKRHPSPEEIKKLRLFLESYNDVTDDADYFIGSVGEERKKKYLKEKMMDDRDRELECAELAKLEEEWKREESAAADQSEVLESVPESPKSADSEDLTVSGKFIRQSEMIEVPNENNAEHTSTMRKSTSLSIMTNSNILPVSSRVSAIFGIDDDSDVQKPKADKNLALTKADVAHITVEERRQLLDELIAGIPSSKDSLFTYPIRWDFLSALIMDVRIRKWIDKKIVVYIGEHDDSFCDFICESINKRVKPNKLMEDMAQIIDKDAEPFLMKLWRLIIYETESKRLGISKYG